MPVFGSKLLIFWPCEQNSSILGRLCYFFNRFQFSLSVACLQGAGKDVRRCFVAFGVYCWLASVTVVGDRSDTRSTVLFFALLATPTQYAEFFQSLQNMLYK